MKIQRKVAPLLMLALGAGICLPAQAEYEEKEHGHLFGAAVDFDVVYKADVMSTVAGGLQRGTTALGNLDLKWLLDTEKLFGWHGGSVFLYGISNLGGKPNRDYAGTGQGIDNIEVNTNTAKIYQAWVQQLLWNDRLSLLAGLYDLNSEFYVNDTAALFLHPAAGIGTELAATGLNGPSIFPTTSLTFRIKAQPTPHFYIQGAVLDAVSGNTNNPRGTHIDLSEGDGALLIAEAGYLRGDHGQAFLSDRDRSEISTEPFGKYALGMWHYTSKFDDVIDVDGAGHPVQRGNNRGVYFLAEQTFYAETADNAQGLTAFVRYGVANADVNRFDHSLYAGAVYTGLIAGRDKDQFGVSFNLAHNSAKFREEFASAGSPVQASEGGVELTYRMQLTPWFALQPDIQYIINPNTDPDLDNALVLGIRFELALSM